MDPDKGSPLEYMTLAMAVCMGSLIGNVDILVFHALISRAFLRLENGDLVWF